MAHWGLLHQKQTKNCLLVETSETTKVNEKLLCTCREEVAYGLEQKSQRMKAQYLQLQ